MAERFNFQRVIANMDRIKTTLPRVLANETKNYFVGEFNKQQWDGKRWCEPKRKQKTTGSSRNQSATLVQSGTLRRAVINSLQQATFKLIHFEVKDVDAYDSSGNYAVKDVAYAKVHNEGLRAGRGLGFQMPKRQFMGQTKKLGEIQRRVIDKTIDKIWQG